MTTLAVRHTVQDFNTWQAGLTGMTKRVVTMGQPATECSRTATACWPLLSSPTPRPRRPSRPTRSWAKSWPRPASSAHRTSAPGPRHPGRRTEHEANLRKEGLPHREPFTASIRCRLRARVPGRQRVSQHLRQAPGPHGGETSRVHRPSPPAPPSVQGRTRSPRRPRWGRAILVANRHRRTAHRDDGERHFFARHLGTAWAGRTPARPHRPAKASHRDHTGREGHRRPVPTGSRRAPDCCNGHTDRGPAETTRRNAGHTRGRPNRPRR